MHNLKLLLLVFIFPTMIFAQKKYYGGDLTTDAEYGAIPLAATPSMRGEAPLLPRFSLREYAPPVQDQNPYSNCVAWSSAYAARTISYAVQHGFKNQGTTFNDSIINYSFSPSFLFYFIKAKDDDCQKGTGIDRGLDSLKSRGVVLFKDFKLGCVSTSPSILDENKAEVFAIKDYNRIVKTLNHVEREEIETIKKAISEKNPVVIGIFLTKSFYSIPPDGLWRPLPDEPRELDENGRLEGHAMCIVGYDDTVNNGSFEVMNSWGESWGNKGFCWMKYDDFIRYGRSASQLIDYEDSKGQQLKLSGSLDFVKLNGTDMPVMKDKLTTASGNQSSSFCLYKMKQTYPNGTNFRLRFKTNAPAYVYIFAEDDHHIISPIFPSNANLSAYINFNNTPVYLPETEYFSLEPPATTDDICVVYSKEALNYAEINDYIGKTPGQTLPDTVKALYGDRILPLDKINFDNNAIKFSTPASEKNIVCFFIQVTHN